MKVELLPPADTELLEAVSYYNGQSEGLGYEFAAEVKQTIGRIVRFPDAWQKLSLRARRCRTRRFPYGVIYQIRGELILIVAIMHLRRHPDTWKSRLGPAER
jgi:plasmid stabilization system protein ParE